MDVIDQVKKLEAIHFVVFILGFVGVISPGLLILFLFKRDLFISLDSLKLILLSVSLSLPIIMCNLFLWAVASANNKESENDIDGGLLAALVTSSTVLYLPLVVAFLWGLSLHTYIWILVALEIILTIITILMSIMDSSKKKN